MENYRSYCPINLALEVLGDKWSLVIIRDIMFSGKKHFRELLLSEEGIASNILTDRLNMLEREGILIKKQDPMHKQKNIYSLTEKGIDLLPLIVEIGKWSLRYMPVDRKKNEHAVALCEGGSKAFKAVREKVRKEQLAER